MEQKLSESKLRITPLINGLNLQALYFMPRLFGPGVKFLKLCKYRCDSVRFMRFSKAQHRVDDLACIGIYLIHSD